MFVTTGPIASNLRGTHYYIFYTKIIAGLDPRVPPIGDRDVEVLRPEVDSGGYDLVVQNGARPGLGRYSTRSKLGFLRSGAASSSSTSNISPADTEIFGFPQGDTVPAVLALMHTRFGRSLSQ